MHKILGNHQNLSKIVGYLPLIWGGIFAVLAVTSSATFAYAAIVYLVWGMWAPLDGLCILGPIYWITRKDHRSFSIGFGAMHQTMHPWRKGRGIYVALFKRSFQIGLCKKQNLDEEDGILSAVKGRYLDISPSEIGEWNAVQKGNKRPTSPS